MVPESSAICAGSSRGRPHEPFPLFDIEHEIGLSAHQLLRGRGAVEVGRDQLLDFEGLKPNVAPGTQGRPRNSLLRCRAVFLNFG
jgi:hypothetical protein